MSLEIGLFLVLALRLEMFHLLKFVFEMFHCALNMNPAEKQASEIAVLNYYYLKIFTYQSFDWIC